MSLSIAMVHCKHHEAAPAQHVAPARETATVTPGGRVAITVDGDGYHPATIRATAGQPVTMVFTRTTDETCGQQLVFPAQNIHRDLPLRSPVEVTMTPTSGTIAFTCGMAMYHGALVAQ